MCQFSGYLDDEAEFICNCLANPKGSDIYRRCIKRDMRPLRGRTGFESINSINILSLRDNRDISLFKKSLKLESATRFKI
jgi:hypothetical protein